MAKLILGYVTCDWRKMITGPVKINSLDEGVIIKSVDDRLGISVHVPESVRNNDVRVT